MREALTLKLAKAAEIAANGIGETLSYYSLPQEHWRCIRTNNLRYHRWKADARDTATNASGGRHVGATKWGTKRYLQMSRLAEIVAIA